MLYLYDTYDRRCDGIYKCLPTIPNPYCILMKLFDRFLKKPANARPSAARQQANEESNFVDDLVRSFKAQPEIRAAWFGFAYQDTSRQYHLFLAVDHDGNTADISNLITFIRSVHMEDTLIEYASPSHNSEVLDYVRQHNLPFYRKDDPALLQRKIMKQWFNVEKYTQELVDTLKDTTVVSLLYKAEKADTPATFATCVRDNGEFIPLFSSEHMIYQSGMTQIPANKVVTTMPFKTMLEMSGSKRPFLLNPGTPFEVELRV